MSQPILDIFQVILLVIQPLVLIIQHLVLITERRPKQTVNTLFDVLNLILLTLLKSCFKSSNQQQKRLFVVDVIHSPLKKPRSYYTDFLLCLFISKSTKTVNHLEGSFRQILHRSNNPTVLLILILRLDITFGQQRNVSKCFFYKTLSIEVKCKSLQNKDFLNTALLNTYCMFPLGNTFIKTVSHINNKPFIYLRVDMLQGLHCLELQQLVLMITEFISDTFILS